MTARQRLETLLDLLQPDDPHLDELCKATEKRLMLLYSAALPSAGKPPVQPVVRS
jgi:hypothetical protein